MPTAKAKSVMFLFMAGGPSHMETFDPKPLLNKLDGQKRPAEFRRSEVSVRQRRIAKLLGTKRTFKRYGKSGIEVSDLFPHLAECIDDIAVIRSCHGDMVVHSAAQYQLFTGRVIPGFPSMGSWALTAWARRADSLPAYVVMPDPQGALEAGAADVLERLSAGGLSADDVPSGRQAGAESRSAEGRHRGGAAQDARLPEAA